MGTCKKEDKYRRVSRAQAEAFIKKLNSEGSSSSDDSDVTFAKLVDFSNDLNAGMYYLLMENYLPAILYLKDAAKENSRTAQYLLGDCYENGTGVEQDYKQAAYWYRKAAKQGDPDAKEALERLKQWGLI